MLDDDDVKSLLSGTVVALAGNVIGSLSKFLERIVLGRQLTPDVYGDVSIGLAIMSLCVIFALTGLTESIPRYIPRFDSGDEKLGIWATGMLIAGGLAVGIVTVLLTARAELLEFFFGDDRTRLFLLLVLAIPFIVGTQVATATLRGYGQIRYYELVEDVLYPALRLSLLVLLLFAGAGATAAGYAYLVSAIAAFALAHALLLRAVRYAIRVRIRTKELLYFSFPLLISSVSMYVLHYTDTIILGFFRSSFEVGIYAAAYPLAMGIGILLQSFGIFYLPLASKVDVHSSRAQVERLLTLSTKWMIIVTLPVYLVLTLFASDVLRAVYGESYVAGATVLAVLATGFFVRVAAGLNHETLTALGRTKYIMYTNLAAVVGNVVLNVILIPPYGVIGAAIASALAFVFVNLVLTLVLWRKVAMIPVSTQSIRIFGAGTLVLAPTGYIISNYTSFSLLAFPVITILGIFICVLIVPLVGGTQPEDRIVIESVESTLGVDLEFVYRYFQL